MACVAFMLQAINLLRSVIRLHAYDFRVELPAIGAQAEEVTTMVERTMTLDRAERSTLTSVVFAGGAIHSPHDVITAGT